MTKVTMNLTQRDVENTNILVDRFCCRSKAEAVSMALSICASLSNFLKDGDYLFIRTQKGDALKIIIPGMNI